MSSLAPIISFVDLEKDYPEADFSKYEKEHEDTKRQEDLLESESHKQARTELPNEETALAEPQGPTDEENEHQEERRQKGKEATVDEDDSLFQHPSILLDKVGNICLKKDVEHFLEVDPFESHFQRVQNLTSVLVSEWASMQKIKNLQEKINDLEEEKTTLNQEKENLEALLATEREIARKREKRHEKEMKLAKKKLDRSIKTIIEESKRYDLSMAKFRNGQGLRLGWGECGQSEDNRKYKSPDAYDVALNTNSREKKIPPLSIDFKFLEDITVSDDEGTETAGVTIGTTSQPPIEHNERNTHSPSPSQFNPAYVAPNLNPLSPSCSLFGPGMATSYLPGTGTMTSVMSTDSAGIFTCGILTGSSELPPQELDFQGDNAGIFSSAPDSMQRVFNTGDLQVKPNATPSDDNGYLLKPRKRRSIVWNYFRLDIKSDGKKKAICDHCNKEFVGESKKGTSHLLNHLKICPEKRRKVGGGNKPSGNGNLAAHVVAGQNVAPLSELIVTPLSELINLCTSILPPPAIKRGWKTFMDDLLHRNIWFLQRIRPRYFTTRFDISHLGLNVEFIVWRNNDDRDKYMKHWGYLPGRAPYGDNFKDFVSLEGYIDYVSGSKGVGSVSDIIKNMLGYDPFEKVDKAVEEKLDEEISTFYHLGMDDLKALRERRLQQMKKMAEKRSCWISLGHGEYSEKFSAIKASDRVVGHFYRENS